MSRAPWIRSPSQLLIHCQGRSSKGLRTTLDASRLMDSLKESSDEVLPPPVDALPPPGEVGVSPGDTQQEAAEAKHLQWTPIQLRASQQRRAAEIEYWSTAEALVGSLSTALGGHRRSSVALRRKKSSVGEELAAMRCSSVISAHDTAPRRRSSAFSTMELDLIHGLVASVPALVAETPTLPPEDPAVTHVIYNESDRMRARLRRTEDKVEAARRTVSDGFRAIEAHPWEVARRRATEKRQAMLSKLQHRVEAHDQARRSYHPPEPQRALLIVPHQIELYGTRQPARPDQLARPTHALLHDMYSLRTNLQSHGTPPASPFAARCALISLRECVSAV